MSGHKFWRITLDTNPDYCNLNCIMCEDHSPYSQSKVVRKKSGSLRSMMDPKLLENIIREAAAMGVKEIIPSTMGEPLIYPHFELFLRLCRELNLTLNLTTNGTFPAPDKYQNVEYWAERIAPIGSDVKISWNGATEATHQHIMRGATLAQHINNAKRFIAVRDRLSGTNYCSVTMQLTYMKSNIDEIPEMLELALDLGFDRLKGHHLWAHFPEIKEESLRMNKTNVECWNETVRACHDRVAQHNATVDRSFKLDNFFELSSSNLTDISPDAPCPFLNKELWIDPYGNLNVCCAPNELRKAAFGDFGRITADTSLTDLVNQETYRQFTKAYMEYDLCKSCNMRRPV